MSEELVDTETFEEVQRSRDELRATIEHLRARIATLEAWTTDRAGNPTRIVSHPVFRFNNREIE